MALPKMKLTKPLTKKGHTLLADEHHKLFNVERPKIVEAISIAAAEGDRSENAEYIYGKKKLRETDYRIRYLDRLLSKSQIIEVDRDDCIYFGRYFEVTDENGIIKRWIIVGEGETDFHEGAVSWKSIVGRALLYKKLGDTVLVKRPAGEMEFEVTAIDPCSKKA